MYKSEKVSVVVAAAGSSRRMKGIDKMYLELGGIPVLARTIGVFEKCSFIDEIVAVVKPGTLDKFRSEIAEKYGFEKLKAAAEGGSERVYSVSKALEAVSPDAGIVMIQDGARPFATQELILRVLDAAYTYGAAVPGVRLRDTVKIAGEDSGSLVVNGTPDRSLLRAVQTPQGFKAGVLREAYAEFSSEGEGNAGKITDDASMVEALGRKVVIVEGSEDNMKITTASDIKRAEMILYGKADVTEDTAAPHGAVYSRTGTGFDVHAFADGRRLVIGGVEIPYERGLAGHSDADVLIHAVMDAALGACALRDIGTYFPDDDPAYEGADSMKLLEKTAEIIRENSFEFVNIDATVIAQAPKMAPYIEKMRENIASAAGISADAVGVKATTTEHLGFTGRKEGIAAQAVVSVIKTNK